MRFRPSSPIVLRLAAEACRDPRVVLKVLEGGGQEMSRAAVIAAAARLGLPPSDPIMVSLSAEAIPPRARAT